MMIMIKNNIYQATPLLFLLPREFVGGGLVASKGQGMLSNAVIYIKKSRLTSPICFSIIIVALHQLDRYNNTLYESNHRNFVAYHTD